MKKIINEPATVVVDALRGFEVAHADLVRVSYDPVFVVRADAPVRGKVALVSGGGSGHEPLHIGFVGPGMLDAAVPGEVFTSPTPDQIVAAVRAVGGGAGVLLIVKNYTGDVLNFELAAEMALAEGIEVRTLVVADDVVAQRGVAGTLVVEKILGAAAAGGADLETCLEIGRHVASHAFSIGVALEAGTVPHVGSPGFVLGPAEVEYGVGIHGEPGHERQELRPARALVEGMASEVAVQLPVGRGDRVLVLTNGMGGTPPVELYLAHGIAERSLVEHWGVVVERRLVGSFVTSLEMRGLSITVVVLDGARIFLPEERSRLARLVEWWDAPVRTAALRWGM
ncbi:dihydroxyacetone kinase subunit DhaK [Saccharothrix violaceirubra]|uniref:Dihydroxyacetone kinase-like protein n=1 Tax=Saccharothrix violaceirubra TaxID=413306 RepID=A0A7W7SZ84_9PSEU|nr:dihydroxyacetone kinase subunit DhaK [Saccharothrix violaceirubra]MBB4963614.1 dihydroxyacetone kinase-like protein [Saccharothrix violaceirubra]